MHSRSSDPWDDVEPELVKPHPLAVHVGRDSESSSQNSASTNLLTSGSSAHASAVEPITPSSDTPYSNVTHVKGVETGPLGDQPHLARLLQGLTLSATSAEPVQHIGNNNQTMHASSTIVSSTAAPVTENKDQQATKSIFDFESPFDALASPVTKGAPMPTPTPPQHTAVETTKYTQPPPDRQAYRQEAPTGRTQSNMTPAPPAAFADLGLIPASLVSKSPVLQKRASMTPQPSNIFAAPSQPSATPVPTEFADYPMDRRRKQLALLESIAGDADRLITPAHTPLMSSRTPAAQFLNYHPMQGQFHPPPPAERQQYPMGMQNGTPRQVLPPSPLYSRPAYPRMVGPESNMHKGNLLNMLSHPTPSATPMPPSGGTLTHGYPQPMYHNSIPHVQHGPGPILPPPHSGPYGAPMYPMNPQQYAPPMPNGTNGGFPPATGLLNILNTNTTPHPQSRPYPTSGLS